MKLATRRNAKLLVDMINSELTSFKDLGLTIKLTKIAKMFARRNVKRPVIFESTFLTKLNEFSSNSQHSAMIVFNLTLSMICLWFSKSVVLLRIFVINQTMTNSIKHIDAHKNVAVAIFKENIRELNVKLNEY